jgi:hypothetical protein
MADLAEDTPATASFFIPVCLYPHTKYRTSEGVLALFEKFKLHGHQHLIVVADRLLALDNLVVGRYWSHETVFSKARQDSKQVYNLIKRLARPARSNGLGRLHFWDEIADTAEFQALA